MPDRYRIPAHWHPTDENIVVVQGRFRIFAGPIGAGKTHLAIALGTRRVARGWRQ